MSLHRNHFNLFLIAFVIIALCIIGRFLFFDSNKDVPEFGKAIKPSLLWKKTCDSRIIKTSVLKNLTMAGEKIPHFPFEAILTEKSVILLDDKGNTKKKISCKDFDKIDLSNEYFAWMKDNKITIAKYDSSVIGTINIRDFQPIVLKEHIAFALSPNGQLIVIASYFTRTIYFFETNGKLLSQYVLEKGMTDIHFKFSKDSRSVVIVASNCGKQTADGAMLYFKNEKKQWMFPFKGCRASFDMSPDGKFILLAWADKIYSFNDQGKMLYEKKWIPGDVHVSLSETGRLAVIQNQERLSVIDNPNGLLMWEKNIQGFMPKQSMLTSLWVSEQGNHIAVAFSKHWMMTDKESLLSIIDLQGKTIWEHMFHKNNVSIKESQDTNFILCAADHDLYLYRTYGN